MVRAPKEELPNVEELKKLALETLPERYVLRKLTCDVIKSWPAWKDFSIIIEYENQVDDVLKGSMNELKIYHAWADPLVKKIREKWPPMTLAIEVRERASLSPHRRVG